jgi:hypothetical protein
MDHGSYSTSVSRAAIARRSLATLEGVQEDIEAHPAIIP